MDEIATRVVQGLILLLALVGFKEILRVPPISEWRSIYREWDIWSWRQAAEREGFQMNEEETQAEREYRQAGEEAKRREDEYTDREEES